MSTPTETRTIVIDNISRSCKVGFAGEQLPAAICKSYVGQDAKTNEIYISNDAQYFKHNASNRKWKNYKLRRYGKDLAQIFFINLMLIHHLIMFDSQTQL